MSKSTILSQCSESWSNEFVDMYFSLRSLWDDDHCDFNSTTLRNKALNKLAIKLREIFPYANRHTAIRCIAELWANFRKEMERVRQNQCYEPELSFYDKMFDLVVELEIRTNTEDKNNESGEQQNSIDSVEVNHEECSYIENQNHHTHNRPSKKQQRGLVLTADQVRMQQERRKIEQLREEIEKVDKKEELEAEQELQKLQRQQKQQELEQQQQQQEQQRQQKQQQQQQHQKQQQLFFFQQQQQQEQQQQQQQQQPQQHIITLANPVNFLQSTNSSPSDQFDATGALVSSKLRNLDNNQRIKAEELIYRILLKAEMNKL